jgi:hypothetical protein
MVDSGRSELTELHILSDHINGAVLPNDIGDV